MKTSTTLAAGALALALSPVLLAADDAEDSATAGVQPAQMAQLPAAAAPNWFTYGGDLRLRYESFDHLPVGGPLGDYWSYFRFRTRVFAQVDYNDFTFNARLVNEWRKLANRHGRNSYPFSDELIFDQLYLEFRDIFNLPLKLRAGRQDLMLGSLRVLGEGTAGNGSRSFYFDALRLTYTPVEQLNIDLIGTYNRWYDPLAIGGLDDDIVRDHKRDLNGNRSDEAGAILYLTDQRSRELPYEAYYIWKHETTDARGSIAGGEGRDTHTFGGRLLPNFSSTLSGEFEAALQLGRTEDHRDIHAFMLYGGVTQTFEPIASFTPYIGGAALMLSGDKSESSGHISAWNPLWGRLPAFGDLSGMMYPGMSFWYQNLIYPHLELGFYNGKTKGKSKHYLRFQTGPMFAQYEDASDVASNMAGDGAYRGWHFFTQYGVPLIKKPLGPLQDLTAMLEADCLLPGDYFNESSPIYFLRVQLLASF